MFAEAGSPHQDEVGIFSVDPVELIAGSLSRRQTRLVEAWAELHQAELKVELAASSRGTEARAN